MPLITNFGTLIYFIDSVVVEERLVWSECSSGIHHQVEDLIPGNKPRQYKPLMERERCGKFDRKFIKSTIEPFPVSTGTFPVERIKSLGFVNSAVSPFEGNAQRWSKACQ